MASTKALFKLTVAHKETGEQKVLQIRASSRQSAEAKAQAAGYLVAQVEQIIEEAEQAPPETTEQGKANASSSTIHPGWPWTGGIVLILLGISALTDLATLLAGPMLLIAGASLLPPVWRWVLELKPSLGRHSILIRLALFLVSIGLLGLIVPEEETELYRPFANAPLSRNNPTPPTDPLPADENDPAVLGKWKDDSPGVGATITIRMEEAGPVKKQAFIDGSTRTVEMIEDTTKPGRWFKSKSPSPTGDHWVINAAGDLEIRDQQGLIVTARQIK